MHHLKNTEHEMVKEKLTREGHKRGNTFIKDKPEKKHTCIQVLQHDILEPVTLIRIISIKMKAATFMAKLCTFCN